MKSILSLKDLAIKGKKVLMRVDFNVPQDDQGAITDDSRIEAALPSIKYVLDKGGSLILMSHLGRPKELSAKYSLAPIKDHLSKLLDKPILFAKDCGGEDSEKLAQSLKEGEVLLLENLRFNPAEEKPEKDPSFAKKLAELGDCYVDEAFGAAHRSHTSITEVPKYFPKEKAAGFLLETEIEFLEKTTLNPEQPFVALIGGAKISTKLGVINTLSKKAESLLIGGAMAFTLLKAKGMSIGDSLCEEGIALPEFENLVLPIDFVAEKQGEVKIFEREIPAGWKGMDIGPKTVDLFKTKLALAKTILWNGPMGVYEDPRFAKGTEAVAKIIAELAAISIVGGGDSICALKKSGLQDKISHLSTGGGATLEYIEFGDLPGVIALKQ